MSMKIEKMGWYVAIALAGAMCGMGFKAPGDKIGSVDLSRVFNESEFAKKQSESLRAMGAARQDVLQLISTYRTMRPEDAQKFHDLSLKATPAPTDKDELDKIKAAAIDSDKLYRALATKASPQASELTQIEELNRRKDSTGALQQKWATEFDADINTMREKLRADTLSKAKDAVNQVGKDQGFSIVFVSDVAPYSANDLTDAALKQMNKKQ